MVGTVSLGVAVDGVVVVDGWGPLADEVLAQLRRCGVAVRGGRHAADGAELAMAAWQADPAVATQTDRAQGGRHGGDLER